MSTRIQIIHKEKIGPTTISYRADINDSEFSGTAEQRVVSDNFFDWEYDKIDERDPFENPVQKSRFTCDLLIQESSELSILNDILDADEDRFTIEFYIDGDHKWTGKVLNDLLEYPEGPFPFTAEIKAKDLSHLEGVDYDLVDLDTMRRISIIIANCLKETGLTLPIRSYTNLTNEEITDNSEDFLYALFHQKSALRDREESITRLEVLENICRTYNLIIRQSDARWIIEQLPAVAKGDDVQFDYDSDGLNPSSSTPDRTITIDRTDKFLLPTSINKITGALKSITSEYQHRVLIRNISTYNEDDDTSDVELTDDIAPETFDLNFDDNNGRWIFNFSLNVEAVTTTGEGDSGTARVRVEGIRAGSDSVYLEETGAWNEGINDIEIDLAGSAGTVDGSLEILNSDLVLEDVTTIRLYFFFADVITLDGNEDQDVDTTTYTNINASLYNQSTRDWQATLKHKYTRTGSYSVKEQIESTLLGDGPTSGINFASKGRPGTSAFADNLVTPGNFKLRGQSSLDTVTLEELTLRERLSMRRNALRNIRAKLWMKYSPENLISYDSETWFFLGGHFVANQSQWDGNILLLDYDGDTSGDTFTTIVEEGGDPGGTTTGTGGSTGGGGVSLSEGDERWFNISDNLSEGDPATIRANLGLQIGTDVQAHDAILDDVAANDGSAALDLASLDVDDINIDGNTIQAQNDQNLVLDGNGNDVLVNGDTIKVDKEMTTTDNVIVLNDGETGSGITAGEAGLQFDRGTETNYEILFQESNGLFSIGEVGSLQAVATRPDSPDDTGLTFWNDTENWIETDPNLTFDGSELSTPSLSVNGQNLFPDDDVQTLGTGDNVEFAGPAGSSGIHFEVVNSSTRRIQTSNNLDIYGFSLGLYESGGEGIEIDSSGDVEITSGTLTGTEVDLSSTLDVGGVATFEDDVILGNQATSSNHALRADRTLQLTSDDALSFDNETARNLTTDLSWALSIEDHGDGQRGVITAGAQDIYGAKTFEDNLFAKGTVGSPDFASRTTDWQVTKAGAADFRSVFSDSIITKAFTADVAQAFRGSRFLTKSFATVKDGGFTIPAVDSTVSVTAADVDGFTGLEVFEQDDYVLVQLLDMEWQGDGLLTGEVWGEITSSITDNGDGTQTFDFTVRDLSAPELEGEPIQEGNEMLSFGSASDPTGFIHDTVLDDSGSPYSQVITWTTNPWDRANWDIRLRSGILDGITGLSGAGVYTENFYGTESILIGDLDQAGNYIEYENGVLTVDGILQVGGSDVATEAYADQAQSDAESYADGLDSTLRGTLNGILDDAVTNDTTIISGGFIETSFINTDAIAVGDLSDGDDYALETYVDTAESDAIATSRDDVAQRLGFSDYANMYDLAADGETLIVGGVVSTDIIDTHAVLADVGTFTDSLFIGSDQEHVLDGANNEVSFSDGLLTADGGAGSVIVGDASKSDPYLEAVGTELNAVGLNLDVTSLPRVSDEGLLAQYHFERSSIDSVGNFSEELEGDPTFAEGVAGRAIEFDTSVQIDTGITNNDLSETGEVTIVFPFSPSDYPGDNRIIMSVDDTGSNRSWDLRFDEDDDRDIEFTTFGSLNASATAPVDLDLNTFYTIVLRVVENDQAEVIVYDQDGNRYEDSSSCDTFDDFPTHLVLNGRHNTVSGRLRFLMDDLHIFTRKLSDNELKRLVQAPSGNSGGLISTEQLVADQAFLQELWTQQATVTGGSLTLEDGATLSALDSSDNQFFYVDPDTEQAVFGDLIGSYIEWNSGDLDLRPDSLVIDTGENGGGFTDANFFVSSEDRQLSLGSVFSADGSSDEGRLASSYLDGTDLWGYESGYSGDTSDKSNASIRLDFDEGRIYSKGLGGPIFTDMLSAPFGENTGISETFLDSEWIEAITITGDGTDSSGPEQKRAHRYTHFHATSQIILSGYTRRTQIEDENPPESATYRLILRITPEGTGTATQVEYNTDSASWEFFELIINAETLTDGANYRIDILQEVQIEGSSLNSSGAETTGKVHLRRDYNLQESA